jgi:hypothetical protein
MGSTRDTEKFHPIQDNCTTSEANMILAKAWLDDCLASHQTCSDLEKPSLLPRHVIDVSNAQLPRLFLGSGRVERYATLSYRWGESAKYTTTSINYQHHLREIPLEVLPMTYQDAIMVTNKLGI